MLEVQATPSCCTVNVLPAMITLPLRDGPPLLATTRRAVPLPDPVRQGPSLFKVVGRQAGKLDDFHYSPGFGKADFVWDDARLDAYLANPQGTIPGSVMAYRQPKPETRAAIIAYLKELN